MSYTLTESQAAAWNSYQQMRARLSEQLSRELAAGSGLSTAEYEVLTALIDMPDETARTLALRCGLGWEKSRLSHQLRRMETRGLIAREECAEDNRSFIVRITDAGRELAAEAARCHDAAVRRYVVDALSEEQLVALGEIAEGVLVRLEEYAPAP